MAEGKKIEEQRDNLRLAWLGHILAACFSKKAPTIRKLYTSLEALMGRSPFEDEDLESNEVYQESRERGRLARLGLFPKTAPRRDGKVT